MDLKKYKLYRQILWFIALIWKPIFKIERKLYKNNKIKKNRLFITTGNVSLIYVLALLKDIKDDNYDDYLIIESVLGSKKFWDINLDIAKLHKFKKIFTFSHIRFDTAFILNNLYYFDEIFVINKKDELDTVKELFNNTKINLLEEGFGSLCNFKFCQDLDIEKSYFYKYLSKIDGLNMPENISNSLSIQDSNNFNNIANQITEKYPLDFKPKALEKSILLCGTCWIPDLDPDKETFINNQIELIKNLTDCGYKIYYKSHPRAEELYEINNNKNVQIIDSVLPIELYKLDILAVVSSSTCSISYAHYWGVPGFSDISEYSLKQNNKLGINTFRYIVKQYSPDYRELLKFDVKNTSREELKQRIKETYNDFIKSKPLLSQNQEVKEYARKYEE